MLITGAVEGNLDEVLLRRVVDFAGLELGLVYGRKGKSFLFQSMQGFNSAARYAPWIILVDLDNDFDCAPALLTTWLPEPAPKMYVRVVVRAVESWILADRTRIAHWLRISEKKIPADPDNLSNPKRTLIDLARHSRSRRLQQDLVPRENSGRKIGPLYNARLTEFLQDGLRGWRPAQAMRNSESLKRCVERLRTIDKAEC